MIRYTLAASAILVMAACSPEGSSRDPAGSGAQERQTEGSTSSSAGDENQGFTAIRPEETVHFTGTEPFWGGQVSFTSLAYSTPETPDGASIEVARFSGRGGVSWSGQYKGAPFSLAVTPGNCSDGMSDRSYSYVATLEVQGEQREGCAWTDRQPFTGPPSGASE